MDRGLLGAKVPAEVQSPVLDEPQQTPTSDLLEMKAHPEKGGQYTHGGNQTS